MYYRKRNQRNILIAAGIIASMLAGVLLVIWLVMLSSAPEPSDQAVEASPQPDRTATSDARPEPTATREPEDEPTPTPESEVEPTTTPEAERTFYVSKDGDNTDGLSWETAWNELDQIEWDSIRPGDTILLDGGASEMRYTSTLEVGASGTPDQPITIKLASEEGRNGQVVIFGGRSEPLPFCGQRRYNYQTDGVSERGVYVEDAEWVVIDGLKWRGIAIHGHNRYGIELRKSSSNITFRNVEIYDNGIAYKEKGKWYPDLPGVNFSGSNNTFERAIVYDNGQDAFQSGGGVENFTLRESWLYVGRNHPQQDTAFNRCRHQDGIQIYGGGVQSGVTIEDSVFGPGLLHGVLLGESDPNDKHFAQINDVTIRNSLFYKADHANISAMRTSPKNWVIENVTSYRDPNSSLHNILLESSGHTIRNSVFVGGLNMTVSENIVAENNCLWEIESTTRLGKELDPQFNDVEADDYTLQPDSPCAGKGSRITSPESLLGQSTSIVDSFGIHPDPDDGIVSANRRVAHTLPDR